MQRKPKIVVIGLKGLPAFGGAAAVGENIIGQLKEHYDFTVLSSASHTDLNSSELNGIRQIVFKNYGRKKLNTFIYYFKCLYYCLANKYDLIQLHHAESGFITPLLRLKNKVIVTFHGIYNYNDPKFSSIQNRFFRFSEKLNVRYANEVISVSRPDQTYVKQKYGREIRYIPNGITIGPEISTLLKEKSPDDYILFAAGRIYQIKGLHLLFEAAIKIGLNNKIIVAGDHDQVPKYRKTLEQLSKGLHTEFKGLIKDRVKLLKLVSRARLFIFPSLTEAMSMMLLEAVSMKTPVIASDIPSNKAIFNDDEMLFFKSNDPDDLAEKLNYALLNPAQMITKADKAFIKLTSSYDWKVIANMYKEIYEELLKR